MKRALYTIGLILICLLIGYGVGMGIGHLINEGGDGNIDKVKMAKAVLTSFVALIISVFANVILHEAGHLVGGLLTGYKFLSFRIFKFTLQKEDDGWHWKKFNIPGTLGQCLMCPPHTEPVPYFWYNVGGVMANLIVGIVNAALLIFADLSALSFTICAMLLGVSIWLMLINGIPMTPGGTPNDGKNILILWRHPEQRKYFHNMLAVVGEQSQGKRLSELPEDWFYSEPVTKDSTVMEISARSLYYSRLADEMRFEEARLITEELTALGESLPMIFQMELSGDRLLLELITLNRNDVVDELWNKKFGSNGMNLQKYVTSYSKYFPLKNCILFAYETFNNQSPESAQRYYDEVESKRNAYTQPGEARTAMAIMEKLTQQISNNASHPNYC